MKLIFETQIRTKAPDNWFGSTWNFWFFWIPSSRIQVIKIESSKKGFVFHVATLLHHADFGSNDHWEHAPHFNDQKFEWFFSHMKAYYSDANEGGRYKPLGRFPKSCLS